MQYVQFAKMALVVGFTLTSLLAQPAATHAQTAPTGTGKTLSAELLGQPAQSGTSDDVVVDGRIITAENWDAGEPETAIAADVVIYPQNVAKGIIRVHKSGDVTLKRGVIAVHTGAIQCSRSGPGMVLMGEFFAEIDGSLVAQGEVRVQVSRPASGTGGGDGDILVFDIVDAVGAVNKIEARGQLEFRADACR